MSNIIIAIVVVILLIIIYKFLIKENLFDDVPPAMSKNQQENVLFDITRARQWGW